jgi:hypothetical protein
MLGGAPQEHEVSPEKGIRANNRRGYKNPSLSGTVLSAHPGAENIAGVSAKQPERLVLR